MVDSTKKKLSIRDRLLELAVSCVVGISAFLTIIGPRVLDPRNIAWLNQNDASTNYLGWAFFRKGPWTFPVGLNPNYGLDISSSIVFSDSNAFLAILLKPFSSFLQEPFQYIGLWLLACFILQAFFALKLVRMISMGILASTLAASIFAFSPAMLFRLHGHYNLVAHFLILGSLYITLKPDIRGRHIAWGYLLFASALTHAYLFFITFVIWIADLLDRQMTKQIRRSAVIGEFLTLSVVTFIVIWQAGYLAVAGSEDAPGLGVFSMNFLAPFDPNAWSYVLRDIPSGNPGQYEGFNYLGLGVIVLGLFLVPFAYDFKPEMIRQIHDRRHLVFLILSLSLLSLSNTACIGEICHTFHWPTFLEKGLSVFRATGRLFWPAYYLIVLIIISMAVSRFQPKKMITLLGLCLVIQVADTSKAWVGIRNHFMQAKASNWDTHLVDPFWERASEKYNKVVWLYPENNRPGWRDVAAFAEQKGMATNSIYMGRVNKFALESSKQIAQSILRSGSFEKDSLYILDESLVLMYGMHIHTESDLLARVDGLTVVAPDWKNAGQRATDEHEITVTDFYPPPLSSGTLIKFGQDQDGLRYLGTGWSETEPSGTWSDGKMASLLLKLKTGQETSITLEVKPFIGGALTKQSIAISVDGGNADEFVVRGSENSLITVNVPQRFKSNKQGYRMLEVKLKLPNATRPIDVGINDDERHLGLFLVSLRLE